MTAKVILNPYARRWTALARRPEAEAALRSAGLEFDLEMTEAPGHAIELAARAAREGFSPIIAAGGDSTINEVVNGILQGASESSDNDPVLGVLPLGTANDLVDNLGMPKDLNLAAQVIKSGYTRQLDVCRLNGRYFVNNSGVGLEPYITSIQMRIHRVQGILRYLLATLTGIYRKPQWDMDITWEGGSYHGPVSLVSVGNSPRTGGLFFLTPHANAFDGKLTFLYGFSPSRSGLLTMLPKAMRPAEGNVSEDPRAYEAHTSWLTIHSHQPTPIHTDGELITESATDLEYSILPARLPLLLPAPQE